MNILRENAYGGLDVFSQQGEFLAHLGKDDLVKIYEVQQMNYDVDTVKGRIPDWVAERHEQDDYFLADFNSHLFSNDEISIDEICQKILSDDGLVRKIAEEYRQLEDHGFSKDGEYDWWQALNEAIKKTVDVKDVLGDILCDKYPKEFSVGSWRVAVMIPGEVYGNNSELCNDTGELQVVFYDMSQGNENCPAGGRVVGQFCVEALLVRGSHNFTIDERVEQGAGLLLPSSVSNKTVNPGDLQVIGAWLRSVYNRCDVVKEEKKIVCRGNVSLPPEVVKLVSSLQSDSPVKFYENMIKARLTGVPEFYDVLVEQFDFNDKNAGFGFSFAANVSPTRAGVLLQGALQGISFEAHTDLAPVSLESTLNDAQERSKVTGSAKAKEDVIEK